MESLPYSYAITWIKIISNYANNGSGRGAIKTDRSHQASNIFSSPAMNMKMELMCVGAMDDHLSSNFRPKYKLGIPGNYWNQWVELKSNHRCFFRFVICETFCENTDPKSAMLFERIVPCPAIRLFRESDVKWARDYPHALVNLNKIHQVPS